MKPSRAYLHENGRSVVLEHGTWTERFDKSVLPSRLSFYTDMRDRREGNEKFYGSTVTALETLHDEIAEKEKPS